MNSLRFKILLLTVVPLTIVLLIIGGLTINNKISTERELLLERLNAYRVLLESGDLTFDTSADKVKLGALLDENVEFSEILSDNQTAIYSSEDSVIPLFTIDEQKEINDAFSGIQTTKYMRASENRKAAFVIISPLIVNNRVVAVIHQGLSNEKSDQRVREYAIYIFAFIFGGIAICFIFISILLNTTMLGNIYRLKQASDEIGKGNLDTKIEIKSNDEIGILAHAFDSMRQAIKSQTKKLEEYSKNLENNVEERTKEIKTKNEDLEKSRAAIMNIMEDLQEGMAVKSNKKPAKRK
jgi:nitrate/nitrite-specific signal transduction histidine kinase